MTTDEKITALKPVPEAFEPAWSATTLADILAEPQQPAGSGPVVARQPSTHRRRGRHGGPRPDRRRCRRRRRPDGGREGRHLELQQAAQHHGQRARRARRPRAGRPVPDRAGHLRGLDRHLLLRQGLYASSDGDWDGEGVPSASQLEHGCGGIVLSNAGEPVPFTRPDQLGGFFKDDAGPLLYGVSPYPDAVAVHVRGDGVDRTLPLRADSHGYGAALPEAADADALTLTFLDDAGAELGSTRWVAPVG